MDYIGKDCNGRHVYRNQYNDWAGFDDKARSNRLTPWLLPEAYVEQYGPIADELDFLT